MHKTLIRLRVLEFKIMVSQKFKVFYVYKEVDILKLKMGWLVTFIAMAAMVYYFKYTIGENATNQ